MRLGVLGRLLVVDDTGCEVPVAAARHRTVLAALLVRANHIVPVDALTEIVWDGKPPDGAAQTLRSYVARLRHTVGPGMAARIETRDPGYLCRVTEDELDVRRFEASCREAGAAVRAGAWAEAAAAAARALELCRGAPLLDVPSQTLREQFVPWFEQLRLQALEDRVEAELRLGEHRELVPDVRDLAARHPLRERFHAQLMLALARCGRRAEALEAYQEARRVLVGELGIEPGPELRALQERILAGDEELLTPRPAEASGAGVRTSAVPRQLPAAPGHFTGRKTELDTITGLLEQDTTGSTVVISAIDGMAGIGKTALAVHAAHRLAEHFPDGQLFIDLHGYTKGYEPRTAGEALDQLLRTLGVSPQRIPVDLEERAALYRERLAGTRTLILLDNAANDAQVRPLFPGTRGCLVLVTSRRRLKALDDAHALPLDLLPMPDAIALFRHVAGPGRVPADDPLPARISDLCGRLPLALRIAATLIRHRRSWTLTHLADKLREGRPELSEFFDGDRSLATVFDLSYHALTDDQQRLFRRLGVVPEPDIDTYGAAALLETDPAHAERLLQDLVDHNLLTEPTAGRYQMHDLIRSHAHTLATHDPTDQSDAAMDRLLDYYQHTAVRADALIARYTRPDAGGRTPAYAPALPDSSAARAWLRDERANLLACLKYAAAHARHERVIALTTGLATLLRDDGPWSQAIALHTTAIAAAEHVGDRRAQAGALIDLGEVRRLTGDFPSATRDLRAGLDISRETGDRRAQAGALIDLGEVRALTGDYPGATRDLEAGLDISRETGDRRAQAGALTVLGDVRRMTGDLPGATRDLEAALEILHECGDRRAQANALTRLGIVRSSTGDYAAATHDLRRALGLHREIGSRAGQADTLIRLADIRRMIGDLTGAADDLRQAHQLYREIGERNGQASALTYLGTVRRATEDLPGAIRDLEHALKIFREIGARGNEAWALNHYAAAVGSTGDLARAQTLYRDALRLAHETRQPDEQALALEGIGDCHLRTGDTDAGVRHLTEALAIFQRLTMRPDTDRVTTRLAHLAADATEPPRMGG